ncbi:ABC transporter substrate-binding protein [Chachezhania sediminis]|uniref:ABC transporter substrate-binding protein n=1 Tax=Chachezhania sediminis TaxID=2599291 RepID=UPI00131E248F|nr:ABC transporter substrate-binding protein [Chachezhania sediminis]
MTRHSRLAAGTAAIALAAGLAGPAAAEGGFSGDTIKIGILNDMNGPYSDTVGPGLKSVVQWAVDDFGGAVNGVPVEVLNADTQLKTDIASTTSRRWIDEDGVDVLVAGSGSPIALAAMEVAKEKGVAVLNTGGLSSDLSGKLCTDTATHWSIDTYAAARMGANAGKVLGAKKWFFITADYSFGESLQRDTEAELAKGDATVVGSVRAPLGTTDFSSFLLQAQASGADIVAMANAGNDTMNALKQANEFGLAAGGQKIIGLVTSITDTHAIGLDAANGLIVAESFYWDRDDETRAFSKRFSDVYGRVPTQSQADAYSAVTHYLRAAEAAGSDDGRTVTAQMKTMPVKDFFAIDGVVRPDGRMVPKYLYMLEAKAPADSQGPWDLYKVVEMIPGDSVYRPLEESPCPLLGG